MIALKITDPFSPGADLFTQLKCPACGKIQYPVRERAMFTAVFLAARYGDRLRHYLCQDESWGCDGFRPWHLTRVTSKKNRPGWRQYRRASNRRHRQRRRAAERAGVAE